MQRLDANLVIFMALSNNFKERKGLGSKSS
jgi:hypothetical protein